MTNGLALSNIRTIEPPILNIKTNKLDDEKSIKDILNSKNIIKFDYCMGKKIAKIANREISPIKQYYDIDQNLIKNISDKKKTLSQADKKSVLDFFGAMYNINEMLLHIIGGIIGESAEKLCGEDIPTDLFSLIIIYLPSYIYDAIIETSIFNSHEFQFITYNYFDMFFEKVPKSLRLKEGRFLNVIDRFMLDFLPSFNYFNDNEELCQFACNHIGIGCLFYLAEEGLLPLEEVAYAFDNQNEDLLTFIFNACSTYHAIGADDSMDVERNADAYLKHKRDNLKKFFSYGGKHSYKKTLKFEKRYNQLAESRMIMPQETNTRDCVKNFSSKKSIKNFLKGCVIQ